MLLLLFDRSIASVAAHFAAFSSSKEMLTKGRRNKNPPHLRKGGSSHPLIKEMIRSGLRYMN